MTLETLRCLENLFDVIIKKKEGEREERVERFKFRENESSGT